MGWLSPPPCGGVQWKGLKEETAMTEFSREVRYVRRMGYLLTALTTMLLIVLGLYAWPLVRDRFFPVSGARPITPRGPLVAAENIAIDVFLHASPSVVYITTETKGYRLGSQVIEELPQGSGSGFIWDEQGDVVTNFHVIMNAIDAGSTTAHVILSDQTTYEATVIGFDASNDLAVLKIDVPLGVHLAPIPLGKSSDLVVGQATFAIGNPFGLDQSLTTGVISALRRSIPGARNTRIEDVIQTDAAINPGNSGGPLLDSAGRLIGINTAIWSPSGAWSGIGFAISVDTANRAIPHLIANGRYQRARLGITLDDSLRLPRTINGVAIRLVKPGSPADGKLTGLAVAPGRGATVLGDVIQAVNGQVVKSNGDYYTIMDQIKPGETVTLKVWNGKGEREVKVETE
jgi:S1-C subfamily serine protease